MMVSPSRLSLVTGTAILGFALVCAMIGADRAAPTDAHERARAATARLDRLAARQSDSARAISLAYLERSRLGLGDPFRLVDEATHDPRLDASTRPVVAWAILDRVFQQSTYEIDASVLDAVGPAGAGADHLALIERTVRDARNPRSGETTLRLAYALAAARGDVSSAAMNTVVEAAALLRDRVLAESDLTRAVSLAADNGASVLDEISQLRAARELTVEQPLLRPLSRSDEDDAIGNVPHVLAEIEAIHADSSAVALSSRSLVPVSLAPIVARLGARRPPSAPTRVTIQTRGALLRDDPQLSGPVRRFLSAATNEETLVAANSYVDHFSGNRSIAAARVLISVAVALRASAQEPVWFAESEAPTAGEIAGMYGVRRVEFDAGVPAQWRPYYLRMIASSFDDLRRIMPSYDPAGLTIKFVTRTLPDSALAMHDPRSHALLLPILTAAGTIGHELAHDLDWQAARRLFARGGGYATDRSLRENSVVLGASMRGLAAAHAVSGRRGVTSTSSRPAEVFARGADWFIADALAQIGRSSGYLSGIEDHLLSGYATASTDAPELSAAGALVNGMSEMTAIPDSIESAYLERWQSVERLDPASVVARIRDAAVVMRRPPHAFGIPSATADQLTRPSTCLLDRLHRGSSFDRLRAWAIEAKSHGLLARRALALPIADRPAWAHAVLGDPTWNPLAADEMLRRARSAVLESAGHAGLVPMPPAPFIPAC